MAWRRFLHQPFHPSSSDIQLQGSPGFANVHLPVPQVHHVRPYCFPEVPVVLTGVADGVAPQALMPNLRPSIAGLFAVIPPYLCNQEVSYHLSQLFQSRSSGRCRGKPRMWVIRTGPPGSLTKEDESGDLCL